MSEKYTPQEIEPKWQAAWEAVGQHDTVEDPSRPKWYALTMLPYPSGDLHTGHWYAMTPSDAGARYRRMNGYNVFFPPGFDAFGLPAENAAIKNNVHPKIWTYKNIERMRIQLRAMGAMWAWDREAVTCDPDYYKWSQWFFRKLYDMGLAYREFAPVDWCPNCNTTLAREQVWGDDRHCERCGTPVIKKELNQWKFRITNYAEELLADMDTIDWPERVKVMQTNWIGRSEGAEVRFPVASHQSSVISGEDSDSDNRSLITVFTTRPDTLWGATFMVLAPEHPLVQAITTNAQRAAVDGYIEAASRLDEVTRGATDKEKTGVFTGGYAINPVNGERIPIWIADYVMMGYGTGAIMAVPGHDERDFAFAQKFGLEIRRVITGPEGASGELDAAYDSKDEGEMINSGSFDGTPVKGAAAKVTAWLEEMGTGKKSVNYRLRDWLISRQRMWGAPIPMILCPVCGVVPVSYADLPVVLPDDAQFRPTGESPLKYHEGFRNVKCPQCGGDAERETDTLDTFMCSSWYQYAYITPYWKKGEPLSADDTPWDPAAGDYWLPVDQYTGGIEHATMHLLYTRFFTKAMRDMGIVPFAEPMERLFNQGMILGPDGEKMSKSRGNVVNPDTLIASHGTDSLRLYLMFLGPLEAMKPWNPRGIEGVHRFLHRVWRLAISPEGGIASKLSLAADESTALVKLFHETVKKVGEDIEGLRFNTAISQMMVFNNAMHDAPAVKISTVLAFVQLLAPFAPHLCEELWARLGGSGSLARAPWPKYDPAQLVATDQKIIIQVNGKHRGELRAPLGATQDEVFAMAKEQPKLAAFLEVNAVRRVIFVPGKILNVVVD